MQSVKKVLLAAVFGAGLAVVASPAAQASMVSSVSSATKSVTTQPLVTTVNPYTLKSTTTVSKTTTTAVVAAPSHTMPPRSPGTPVDVQ